MPAIPENGTVHPPTDSGFRLAIIAATALVFAAVFGWLACIQRTTNGEVEFHWQWQAWLWIVIGIACPVYFWRQIWPVQKTASSGATRRLVKGWAALLIPSLMWMAYPLRFISGQQLLNVAIGLGIAATVLMFGGWMVFRLIRGFADETPPPVIAHSQLRPDASTSAVKQPVPPPPTA